MKKPLKSDLFTSLSIKRLLNWIFAEEETGSIFGIDNKLIFYPAYNKNLRIRRYQSELETPIGVAAGPHSQMAQNIISAWLVGARYIELKTVQALDDLEISKPCIDMNDEGYNCEWSQELKIEESFREYLKAWIIIFILKDKFDWNNSVESGFIFNMSVGYDYEGILKDKVQWFLSKMENCSVEKAEMIREAYEIYPRVKELNIPDKISDNITLSTMHGCPPEEIEKIGLYLIEKKYHTTIKLNPTLLGSRELRTILNKTLNFDIRVPEIAFEHDLKYNDAVRIISNLKKEAEDRGVFFSIKLTNTLETENILNVLPKKETMHYMSGRALHPISINLAKKLQTDFNGELDISFSAGADAFNVSNIISCGLKPVTVSSDLLKPGGYGRFVQYIDRLNSVSLKDSNKNQNLKNLKEYAEFVLSDISYQKTYFTRSNIKTNRELGFFDCIEAPCMSGCGANQNIPDYMYYTSEGDFESAMEVILDTNPFPLITGTVCTQLCRLKCTRSNYDSPLAIRKVKKAVAVNTKIKELKKRKGKSIGKVSIIGAGPSGLSCGYYLAREGVNVDIYEEKKIAGGMIANAIPKFRLTEQDIEIDINKILKSNINIFFGKKILKDYLKKIIKKSDFVYLSTGAQLSKKLNIKGENTSGVFEPLDLLFRIKKGDNINLGKKIVVIGGGNTAMDTARSIRRLIGDSGTVTILYRRRITDMPADDLEISETLEEGIRVIELVSPVEILEKNGDVYAIRLEKMKLSGIDEKGRGLVKKIPNSTFEMEADLIVPAIGQETDKEFFDPEIIERDYVSGSLITRNKKIFFGGDAKRGASSIINGVGDGRKTALKILEALGIENKSSKRSIEKNISFSEHMIRRSFRIKPGYSNKIKNEDVLSFDFIRDELSLEEAKKESFRCLYCDDLCNICVTVCPNRANISYTVQPFKFELERVEIKDGLTKIDCQELFSINQKYQIVNIADFCNECGNCNTFCPSSGAPYKEKPKICLSERSFEAEDRGYYLTEKNNIKSIKFKDGDIIKILSSHDKFYLYEMEFGKIKLSKDKFKIIDIKINNVKKKSKHISLKDAIIMKIILENLPSYLFSKISKF